jgi:hypothetical protein
VPKYRLDAASYFDQYSNETSWLKAHVAMAMAYPPFWDKNVGVVPSIGYHDCYTDKCAIESKAGRQEYVAKEVRDFNVGYAGPFLDDVNFAGGNIPGPRWALADLIEETRQALPTAFIEINAQYHDMWPLMKAHDPDVERALTFVNAVDKEFGVGPTSGIDTSSDYRELIEGYVATLHGKGIGLTFAANSSSTEGMEYQLATYFLVNNGADFINAPDQWSVPGHFWPGFEVDLGEALGGYERSSSGLWTRRFTRGVVYTVEPGAAPQTIALPAPMRTAAGETVSSVTLTGALGVVLLD